LRKEVVWGEEGEERLRRRLVTSGDAEEEGGFGSKTTSRTFKQEKTNLSTGSVPVVIDWLLLKRVRL